MLKDLMHAIFEEEVDDEDEEEVEEVEETEKADTEDKAEVSNGTEEIPEEDVYVRPKPQSIEQAVEKEAQQVAVQPESQPAESEDPEANSIFKGLDVDSVARAPRRKKKSVYHFDRSKLNNGKPTYRGSESVEYQAVISPIFGNLEDENKEFDKVHDAIQLTKPEEADLIRVISPMYGNDLPEPKPAKSIPEYKVKKEESQSLDLSELLEKDTQKKSKQESLFKNTK